MKKKGRKKTTSRSRSKGRKGMQRKQPRVDIDIPETEEPGFDKAMEEEYGSKSKRDDTLIRREEREEIGREV